MNYESQYTTYRTRFLVRARQLSQPLVFTDALGRKHSGRPGDYLVETSGGLFSITPQQIFEDVYVPMEVPVEVQIKVSVEVPSQVPMNVPLEPADRASTSAHPVSAVCAENHRQAIA
jgi:hypothetical protein